MCCHAGGETPSILSPASLLNWVSAHLPGQQKVEHITGMSCRWCEITGQDISRPCPGGEDTDSCSVRSWCGVSIQWGGGYCDVRTVKQHFPECGVASQGLFFCCSIFSDCLELGSSGPAVSLDGQKANRIPSLSDGFAVTSWMEMACYQRNCQGNK